jgi:hypothetical protein
LILGLVWEEHQIFMHRRADVPAEKEKICNYSLLTEAAPSDWS